MKINKQIFFRNENARIEWKHTLHFSFLLFLTILFTISYASAFGFSTKTGLDSTIAPTYSGSSTGSNITYYQNITNTYNNNTYNITTTINNTYYENQTTNITNNNTYYINTSEIDPIFAKNFTEYSSTWINHTLMTYNLWNSLWTATSNTTYASYFYGARNETLDTYNLWNSSWSACYNSSYMINTYNATYDKWAYNMTTTSLPLSSITDPTTNVSFNFANKDIQFLFTTGALQTGHFQIEGTGNWANDLVHIHQHTGNSPAGSDLLHLEAIDSDVVGLNITTTGTPLLINNINVLTWMYNQTTPANAYTDTKVGIANLHKHSYSNLTGTTGGFCTGTDKVTNVTEIDGVIYVTCATDQTGTGTIPAGMISPFYLKTCPTGWVAADGTGGTPDLRDKFVVSNGTTYAFNSTGGSASYTPAGTVNMLHGHTYTQVPNHIHNQSYNSGSTGGATSYSIDASSSGTSTVTFVQTQNPVGGVATALTNLANQSDTFSGTPATINPPYYSLIYCMKT